MSGQPTYLFGVGATKAGTTWMHRYLAAHPDCHMRAVKELHYFDALDRGQIDRQVKVNRAKADKLAAQLAVAGGAKAGRIAQALADVRAWLAVLERGAEDAAAYRAYLTEGRGDRRLVAISDLNGRYGSTGYIPQVGRAVALIPADNHDLDWTMRIYAQEAPRPRDYVPGSERGAPPPPPTLNRALWDAHIAGLLGLLAEESHNGQAVSPLLAPSPPCLHLSAFHLLRPYLRSAVVEGDEEEQDSDEG